MRSVQRSIIAIGVAAVAGFGGVSGAAAKPRLVLKVAPANPAAKTPITVSLKAPRLRQSRMYYGVGLSVDPGYLRETCSSGLPVVALRAARGGMFTATLNPRTAIDRNKRRWCDGVARVEVRRYGPGPSFYTRVLARRTFPVGTGKADPPLPVAEQVGIPVKMTVLPGSTITAFAPGRPDRSTPVSGIFRGSIPPAFKPNTDVGVTYTTGGLVPAALAADPLCPGTTAPAAFDLGASSQQTLFASGNASMTLVLGGAPSQLFGCGPAGPLSGTTTFSLTGKVGTRGLLELPLNGALTDIPLPGGSTGGLAANLIVNVDLSGRG